MYLFHLKPHRLQYFCCRVHGRTDRWHQGRSLGRTVLHRTNRRGCPYRIRRAYHRGWWRRKGRWNIVVVFDLRPGGPAVMIPGRTGGSQAASKENRPRAGGVAVGLEPWHIWGIWDYIKCVGVWCIECGWRVEGERRG